MTNAEARRLLAGLLGQISPEVDLESIDDEALLHEAVEIDSLDFLNLIAAVHEATGIEIRERDYPAVSTIAGFAAYLSAGPGPGHHGREAGQLPGG
jgi:acyl carrier protein